ncbi:hypothetical protein E2542_SST15507 [Spatholobus suberectus]|nr:hypothetical protein E2542_SST15507 [Spatholobus suberectus]
MPCRPNIEDLMVKLGIYSITNRCFHLTIKIIVLSFSKFSILQGIFKFNYHVMHPANLGFKLPGFVKLEEGAMIELNVRDVLVAVQISVRTETRRECFPLFFCMVSAYHLLALWYLLFSCFGCYLCC